MRTVFTIYFLLGTLITNAQAPQIAVVRPDGTTYICPTFDSAYNLAHSGDYIYLPAGTFVVTNPIAKKLNIIGAGIDSDSSLLGITNISSLFNLGKGSDNSFIEGIKFLYKENRTDVGICLGNPQDTGLIQNITFQRCDMFNGRIAIQNDVVLVQNIYFNECIMGSVVGGFPGANGEGAYGFYGASSAWVFSKCIIRYVSNLQSATFLNNIFGLTESSSSVYNITSSDFYNNVFSGNTIDFSYSNDGALNYCYFSHNINSNLTRPDLNTIDNNFPIAWSNIYTNIKQDSVYQSNYHLKPGNPAINGGNDGTDVGIYGTGEPCKPGWIPSNPHVYYKKISVDSTGVLHATYKVQPQSY